jgi:hypothetical protein
MYEFLHRVGHELKGSQRAHHVRVALKADIRELASICLLGADFVAEIGD